MEKTKKDKMVLQENMFAKLMEIEKFLEYNLNKRINDRNANNRKLLNGSFKEEGSDKIFEGDNFLAYELSRCSAFEVYECYVAYYNYTITEFEKKRIAVKAEWIKNDNN